MQLSLRSQMIAGTAAVVGASAIVMTPVTAPQISLPSVSRVSSAVELTSVVIGANAVNFAADIFDQAALPLNLLWPDYYSNPPTYDVVYAPLDIGIIPDLANQFSSGSLSALVNNLSGYAFAGITSPVALASGVATAVINTPSALVDAATYIAAGNTAAALAALQTQILAPLQSGVQGALAGVGYIADNVIRNIQTVVTTTLPLLIAGLSNAVVGGLTYITQSAVATVVQVVNDLSTLNVRGALQTAAAGFLGPDGTLGQIEKLTTGIGIVSTVGKDPEVIVPSVRSVITSVAQRTGDFADKGLGGITNNPYTPSLPTSAASARSASSARAAAAKVAAAPAAEATAGDHTASVAPTAAPEVGQSASDATAVSATPASVEKPAKLRASRKAVKAAADN